MFVSTLTFNIKDLDPDSVRKSKKFPKDFLVEIKLKTMCKCTNDLEEDEANWNQIEKIMNVIISFDSRH